MKNFEEWNRQKIQINGSNSNIFFREREIWICALGENVGFEQSGQGEQFLRPILILKKFNPNIFWGIPLSLTKRRGRYYFEFSFIEGVKSVAILSQIKLVDAKRLKYLKGLMNEKDYKELTKRLRKLIPES